ncbi:MAG: hypothetical protein NZ529_05175 [Cytophagaceae bacterium]|nr:hypothetical protein [Cytophagaceae bacterium]MDW8456168.1 hypothetical protein [Cytophagaceae bacterium]
MSFSVAHAQGLGNSPYSSLGFGEPAYENGSILNTGMGNAGVAVRHHHFINFLNPACLANNPRIRIDSLAKLDFAMISQRKNISIQNVKETTGGINLSYIAIGLPLSKIWGSAFGFRPFSTVQYNYSYQLPVTGDTTTTVTYKNTSSGGIYKLFFSNGFGITKNITFGVETSYLFGNINNKIMANIPSTGTFLNGFRIVHRHTGIEMKPGIRYRAELFKKIKDSSIYKKLNLSGTTSKTKRISKGWFLNLAATYDYFTPIKRTTETFLYNETDKNVLLNDTLVSSISQNVQFAQGIRTGFSIEKPMLFCFAADFSYYPWSVYKPDSYTSSRNIYCFYAGAEYSPNGQKSNRAKTYRIGFNYVQLPFLTSQGYTTTDMNVSAGITVPFGKRPAYWFPVLPKFNVAIVAGQRKASSSYINEKYLKLCFSLLISEKWFTVPKFN